MIFVPNPVLVRNKIVAAPHDSQKNHVAFALAGVFYRKDGGQSWQPRNRGTRAGFLPEHFSDLGQCVRVAFRVGSYLAICIVHGKASK